MEGSCMNECIKKKNSTAGLLKLKSKVGEKEDNALMLTKEFLLSRRSCEGECRWMRNSCGRECQNTQNKFFPPLSILFFIFVTYIFYHNRCLINCTTHFNLHRIQCSIDEETCLNRLDGTIPSLSTIHEEEEEKEEEEEEKRKHNSFRLNKQKRSPKVDTLLPDNSTTTTTTTTTTLPFSTSLSRSFFPPSRVKKVKEVNSQLHTPLISSLMRGEVEMVDRSYGEEWKEGDGDGKTKIGCLIRKDKCLQDVYQNEMDRCYNNCIV